MITIVILDAELELVPKEIWGHRQVRAYARRFGRRPGELLLDATFCHAAMRKLPEAGRRGRPDIIHRLLLVAFDSPLGLEGKVDAYVHTREGKVFYVPPGTRIPKNYFRFAGLFSKLLQGETGPIIRRVEKLDMKKPIYVLDSAGELVEPSFWHGREGTFVIGGFPRGDYKTEIAAPRYSLSPHPLTAPSALALLLAWIYEGFV